MVKSIPQLKCTIYARKCVNKFLRYRVDDPGGYYIIHFEPSLVIYGIRIGFKKSTVEEFHLASGCKSSFYRLAPVKKIRSSELCRNQLHPWMIGGRYAKNLLDLSDLEPRNWILLISRFNLLCFLFKILLFFISGHINFNNFSFVNFYHQ